MEDKRHPGMRTQIEEDLAVIRRVAARDEALRAGHPSVYERPAITETTAPIERITWCAKCGRHTVAEVGQDCGHCNGMR